MAGTRITAGSWRGRVIDTPPGKGTRPTTAKVREALFNILGASIDGAEILDLFAGSGSLSFEALSRGAATATLVERDRRVASTIAASARRLACTDRITVHLDDVAAWLREGPTRQFDICFLDPPYSDDSVNSVLESLGASPPAVVVCEHRRARQLPDRAGALSARRTSHYGQTSLTFFERDT